LMRLAFKLLIVVKQKKAHLPVRSLFVNDELLVRKLEK
jgi:hypothetical protein